ncbi:MAG: FAD binding domain-containing protein [Candidatus Sericytochromatia bacterium]|nr:FAD binding domain-containing protein [Candidatus Tanganyikabacteria bacterium]
MMRLPPFRYLSAGSLDEAVALLAENAPYAVPVAGGTDLLPNMKRRQAEPGVLVALRGVPELIGVRGEAEAGLCIGAMTPLAEIAAHPALRAAFPALAEAADLVATPQVRRMATLAGNLCADTRCTFFDQTLQWRRSAGFCLKKDGTVCHVAEGGKRCWAVSSSDIAPVLCSLGATIRVVGPGGERILPVSDLYRDDGARPLATASAEILAEVRLPPGAGWRSAYLKLRRREAFDFPVLGVAAAVRLEGEIVREAGIAVGGVASRPLVLPEAQEALIGRALTEETIVAAAEAAARQPRPLENTDYPALYRKKLTRVYIRRALRRIAGLE